MFNYFNYFTEIEERFSQRKGSLHMLSTLDWALVEIWKDAGIPLEAVVRGIDTAFDHWDKRPERHKVRKVNSLAFCAQEVLAAAQEMASASVGVSAAKRADDTGLEHERVTAYIRANAQAVRKAAVPESTRPVAIDTADELDRMAANVASGLLTNEQAEQSLTVLEEKLIASSLAATPNEVLMTWRAEAEREMMPYKRKMQAAQIAQLTQQFVHKRLLENSKLPRLSLFYLF